MKEYIQIYTLKKRTTGKIEKSNTSGNRNTGTKV